MKATRIKTALASLLVLSTIATTAPVYADDITPTSSPVYTGDPGQNPDQATSTPTPTPTTPPSYTGDPGANPGTAPSATPTPPSDGSATPTTPPQAANSNAGDQLILYMNSATMSRNGLNYKATRPLVVKKGVTFGTLRALSDLTGATITNDAKTKENVISRGGITIRLKADSAAYTVNGQARKFGAPVYADKNVLMVPVIAFAQAMNIPYQVDNSKKQIIFNLSTKPTASFKVQAGEIIAGQTQVYYTTTSSSPKGLPIVEEYWEGRQDVFAEPGTYVVRYSVRDSAGQWSEPYSQTIQVLPVNTPPVAAFTTDKDTYRIGEPITYSDTSTDPDGFIVSSEWSGTNKPAFFQAGSYSVSITVKDNRGDVSSFSKTLTVTSEVMYTEDEFNKLFTPAGSNYPLDGSSVKTMEAIPYSYTTEPVTLFRSSGPETVKTDGILYQDTIAGDVRFMLHHKNGTGQNAKLYLIAKNISSVPANLSIIADGMAGPTTFPEVAGRMSVARYFQTYVTGSNSQSMTLQPGQSRLLYADLSANAMKNGDVITFHGDLTSDATIQYTSVLVAQNRDPIAALANLPYLDPNQLITRGSFVDSTRVFEYGGLVGDRQIKLPLTDNTTDPFAQGYDNITNTVAYNSGNYGLLYKLVLRRVAPNTLISLNPRGGLYMGAALINGQVVSFANLGTVSATNQASVLYRTGNTEETVTIWTTPTAGSNLPFTLLFTPMPQKKN
ncbi:stalk domain-containing protein [Cohnella sp. 56]|uniref:stalk domain-containing protein n=1 Tax=Cohnella sp. 56 TaxID=3113722 RepID=UPI0030E84FCA